MLKELILLGACAALSPCALAYRPAPAPLMTPWGEKVTPENAWRRVGSGEKAVSWRGRAD